MGKTQAATKPAEAAKSEETKSVETVFITSTDLAATLGTKGTILRRWLRTLPQFQDSGYTRYKWDPANPADAQFLRDAKDSFSKHQKGDEEKKAARLEEARKKKEAKDAAAQSGDATPKKEKKSKKGAETPAPAETEDEDFETESDEEGEELE